jgi:hypothetical protein
VSADGRRRGVAHLLLLPLLVFGLSVAGCRQVEEVAPAVHQPAVVEDVAGREVKQVRFDQRAADQVDLRTAPVVRSGRWTAVPYAALIYDAEGSAWVYTVRGPLTFQRQQVVVHRIEEARARLRDGPPVGAEVVTRGATEVYGAELDIAGSH